jgi:hypothetical protein
MLSWPVLSRRSFTSLLLAASLAAAVPTPKEYFGFDPGEDYKLANSAQIAGYFQTLAASSDRVKVVEFGVSTEGRPMFVAFISSPANLRNLERYREINRQLALGLVSEEEARKLSTEGKAVVWIDSGLHASEVAPSQHAPHLAYRMLTGEDPETARIRENVILMQVPVINPDGLDMVASWYGRNVGTPYELAPLPWLYQKYAGHDNNRDWFMLNLQETRNVSRLLFREWFPHIVYNQHQSPPFPARIFIPPYAEPLNPNIPSTVMEGINLIGAAMKERFASENKAGTISYFAFDAWWNGGLRSAPAFHNMHGILTETALYQYATPKEYKVADLPERFSNGVLTKEPSVFYERPWTGGRWTMMDAVQYMLTADMAILNLAAQRPQQFLFKSWNMANSAIEAGKKGGPFAYVIAPPQDSAWSTIEMLRRLQAAGVEVRRATAPFQSGAKTYPAGTIVMPAGQPFRGYLIDLMEPQKFPEIRAGQTGPIQRPYDLAGWTLSYQMGVGVDRIDKPVSFAADVMPDLEKPASPFVVGAARRIALYEPYTANIDTGWTQWVFDYFKIPYTLLHNQEFRAGNLRAKFDVVVLAQQPLQSILNGSRYGVPQTRPDWQSFTDASTIQRPEYTGGIGLDGARNLQEFVEQGGVLVALDSATELPLQLFPIGVRGVLRESSPNDPSGWYCPGSLLRITLNTAHPLAAGSPKDLIATSTGGQAFDINIASEFNNGEHAVAAVAWYAKKDLLASGWLSGERLAAGKAAVVEARLGQGRVILFGFRPQFRGQSFGTLPLFLNAVLSAGGK